MQCVEPIRDINKLNSVKEILKNKSQRDYLMFLIGINSGLRISDLLRLKVSDVKNKEFIEIIENKTGKRKRFPISSAFKEQLNSYIENKSKRKYLFSKDYKNAPISRVQAYRIIHKACRQAGIIDKIGTHTLRKTFGYHFYKKHKDIALLQQILNHSTPQITQRYIGINQEIVDICLREFSL